jgi:uncharacterized Zn finger protein (UPF0148 family)
MFEKFLKELKALEKTNISVPIETDEDGYVDRECPNEECLFSFKVDEEDWKELFTDEVVYCPLCRHEANSDSWWTTEQLEEARDRAIRHFESRVDKALTEGAKDFNSKQPKNSFVKIAMTVKGARSYSYILPIPSKDQMALKIKCKECNAKYAVIGSAFFCPCCGHNSADETFDNSIKKIEDKIKNLSLIKKAVEEISKDEAETTCRSIIETSLSEGVVAFQRFCEVTFSQKSPGTKIKFNAFQNLEFGGQYWKDYYGESYYDWLAESDYDELNILFQKRHLLSHTEGIVDQKYIEKVENDNYKVGQRIVIKEKDVLKLLNLIKMIVSKLREI